MTEKDIIRKEAERKWPLRRVSSDVDEIFNNYQMALRKAYTAGANRAKGLIFDGLTILPDHISVVVEGKEVFMEQKKFQILSLLASNPGKVFRRDEIFDTIWPDAYVSKNTIDVHICGIKKIIGDRHIQNVIRVGYKFIV